MPSSHAGEIFRPRYVPNTRPEWILNEWGRAKRRWGEDGEAGVVWRKEECASRGPEARGPPVHDESVELRRGKKKM